MGELTRQLNNCKAASEGELGRLKGEITAEVTNRLSITEQKVTQLTGELEEQTKPAINNSELLRDLLLGIENLGDNMKTMNAEFICLRDPVVQEAEEELNRLHDLVFLTIPVSKGPKVVNILSSDDSFPPLASHPNLFPIGGLEGIPVANMALEGTGVRPPTPIIERISALQKPRLGALVKFVRDDYVHPTFNFGQVRASRPEVFTADTATQSSWPPSSDV